ncbi:Hypothetical protein HVR_LOCUS552 [uncultured virus]|nr:Hypothetical protein HVR_LOCUS552 [uncultured virus]
MGNFLSGRSAPEAIPKDDDLLISTSSEAAALFIATCLVHKSTKHIDIDEKMRVVKCDKSLVPPGSNGYISVGNKALEDLGIAYFDDGDKICKKLSGVMGMDITENNLLSALCSISCGSKKIGPEGPYGISIACLNDEDLYDKSSGESELDHSNLCTVYLWTGELPPDLLPKVMVYLFHFGKFSHRIAMNSPNSTMSFGSLG